MCGIAGLVTPDAPRFRQAVTAMTEAIVHRGPDWGAIWCDSGAVLGHRRLSIIDLSSAGHQPMISPDGRWVISYNGEIYNHGDIRKTLEGAGASPTWQGLSDTETLVAAVSAWGPESTLQAAHGMFALALWDRRERQLILARDRFGEKPLYYGKIGDALAFASELKAFHCVPGFDAKLNPVALRGMLGRGYVLPDSSIYADILQIEPGNFARFSSRGERLGTVTYFDLAERQIAGARDPIANPDEAIGCLRETLGLAVARQLQADVPVGTMLSGGIDSSLITALAVRNSSSRVRTYSIGFAEHGFDEAPQAREVARHLGTDHHEHYITVNEALALIPALPVMYDEPFGDSSQIPTAIVSRFARSHVTVALTGDGGDELFGGYRRHVGLPALWRRLDRVPMALRNLALRGVEAIPAAAWNRMNAFHTGRAAPAFLGHKAQRSARIRRTATSFAGFVSSFLDEWYGSESPVHGEREMPPLRGYSDDLPLASQVMLSDSLTYLPGDILTKVDRAAMAVSLEGRIPFLDPAVATLAFRIPLEQKIAGDNGKQILRRLLYEMVPRALVDRPKAGFAMPVSTWLRGELRDWAESLLSRDALLRTGLLNPAPIQSRWQAHLAGQTDASQALWSVLSFQAWFAHWHDPFRSAVSKQADETHPSGGGYLAQPFEHSGSRRPSSVAG